VSSIGTPNGYDQFLLCLAAARAGAVPVPVNDQMHDNEIAHVISDASADLVIRSVEDLSPVAPILRPARAEVGISRRSSTRPARPGHPRASR